MKRLFAHGNFAVFLPNAGLVIFQLQDQAWEGSEQQDSEFATLHVLRCYLPRSPSGFREHAGVFVHFAPLCEDPFGSCCFGLLEEATHNQFCHALLTQVELLRWYAPNDGERRRHLVKGGVCLHALSVVIRIVEMP